MSDVEKEKKHFFQHESIFNNIVISANLHVSEIVNSLNKQIIYKKHCNYVD